MCAEEITAILKGMGKKKRGRGRPRKYPEKEQLQAKIDQYFAECLEKKEYPTITGLTIALGFLSVQSLHDYAERGEYSDVIKMARLVVEAAYERRACGNNPTGPIFILKNLGWKDKHEMEVAGKDGESLAMGNIEVANRLVYLVNIALARKKEQEQKQITDTGSKDS